MRPGGIRIIGLTGGIASGKSSVARFFQERGVPVIDADQLSRDAVEPGSVGLARIVAEFGTGVLDESGRMDRAKVAAQVFSDARKRSALEAILHPEIKRLAGQALFLAAEAGHAVVMYMAPLLIEAGATERVDEIWVVTVKPEIQMERLMRRDGVDQAAAQRIIASQMSLAEKESYGRIVIDNSGTPEETADLLARIWAEEIEGKQ